MPIEEPTIEVKIYSSRWKIGLVNLALRFGLIALAGWLWELLRPQAIKIGRKPRVDIRWSQITIGPRETEV